MFNLLCEAAASLEYSFLKDFSCGERRSAFRSSPLWSEPRRRDIGITSGPWAPGERALGKYQTRARQGEVEGQVLSLPNTAAASAALGPSLWRDGVTAAVKSWHRGAGKGGSQPSPAPQSYFLSARK
ncbi:hypothetical protein SKAU_G00176790 [Synaphobranchus kaupii]|uniref:Uncharacterized protein n=1 Tax=Synaphobranchus kaupii TaxID=118154 RepID=A0A9Q1IZ51_SYNKA|nr:hypothetical protein SKAU_G00176790 [Synaphobranchus kaupii]